MKKIVVFASGRGSNAAALLEACRDGRIAGEPVLVFSDVPGAPVLAKAAALGVPQAALAPGDFPTRQAYEEAVIRILADYAPDLICLAGYMRLVGPTLLSVYGGRIVNIHPSLLPSFPGLHAQRQAAEAGVKLSGCTVHFVDAGMDTGPIIAQTAVPVYADDTEDSLAERILAVEHATYIEAVAGICRDEWEIRGRRVWRRTGREGGER